MTTHTARWIGEDAIDGAVGTTRAGAMAPLPPAGWLPFAAMAGQPAAVRPYGDGRPGTGAGEGARSAGFATFPLACAAESPHTARRLTRRTLTGWGLERLVDDAAVVVSELVTNALRYGLPPTARHRPLPPASPDQPFLLSLVHCGGSVLCAVFDPGCDVPQPREPDHLRESGRGLQVLASLAESWGWTTPDRHGKAVWAVLQTARDDADPTRSGTATGAQEAPRGAGETLLGPADAEWEPLTRLLLLLELLSGPSWLKALGTSAGTSQDDDQERGHLL
ncbi:ATP-binding protein [Streptomyces sp. 4N509B]|uniref:ATP-binding protein n=1 Tax=Streptomyces sp. 4N509B TaxID=3457413 RepID=UPI003FD5AD8A